MTTRDACDNVTEQQPELQNSRSRQIQTSARPASSDATRRHAAHTAPSWIKQAAPRPPPGVLLTFPHIILIRYTRKNHIIKTTRHILLHILNLIILIPKFKNLVISIISKMNIFPRVLSLAAFYKISITKQVPFANNIH